MKRPRSYTLPFVLLLVTVLLTGCGQIWNAGDLVEWVEQQAVLGGCDADSIELADWYVEKDGANVWQGTCVNEESGATMKLEIGIDSVWTPSADTGASQAATTEDSAPDEATMLKPDQLMNATYSGIYDEPVPLIDGRYEGNAFDEDNPSIFTVEYISGTEVYGDLDGDSVDDAIVFLVERGGGSGAFVYVAAQLNQNGQPIDAGAVWIEDRIGVKAATIQEGQIVLEVITQGPGDAACCSTHKARKIYALQGGKLAEIPQEAAEMERISGADLDGTSWILTEINYDQPVLAEPQITISFAGDQLSGFGGCNNYNSSFTLGDDNPFVMTVGPIASTMMACPDPIAGQETAYFTALENVSRWAYWYGNLVLYYAGDGEGPSRMLFVPGDVSE